MAGLIWAESALNDLESIAEYIAKDSPFYAREFISRIIEHVESLTLFPQMGRIVPETSDTNIRELIYHNYRLVYKIADDAVYIIVVVHGSYDMNEKMGGL